MSEHRDKRYAIRMSIEEMKVVKEVAEHYNLPVLIREYIKSLHEKLDK